MTRGGKRPGAGRPRTKDEKITVPIPVRVTPTELAKIKAAAAAIDTPLGRYVRDCLALDAASTLRLAGVVWVDTTPKQRK